VTRL
jgi:hypothetical protein